MNYQLPKLQKPQQGRRIAIGDIHGCIHTFQALLQQLQLTPNDQLFILGDLIDKGTESKAVVDTILELQKKKYQIFVVKGNHEQSFMTAYSHGTEFFINYLEENETDDFLDDLETYLAFFSGLAYGYDLGDWLICHTAFLIKERSLYRGMRGIFSRINFSITDEIASNKRQITGHIVKTLAEIRTDIQQKAPIISIDGGCVYPKNEGIGYLCAFDLDKEVLIVQENIEG